MCTFVITNFTLVRRKISWTSELSPIQMANISYWLFYYCYIGGPSPTIWRRDRNLFGGHQLQTFPHCGKPQQGTKRQKIESVEGLYCTRPIQCLASSEILTPHPLTAWRVCTPPPPPVLGARGGHTRWVERGRGVNTSSEDARNCSVDALYICKYFVLERDNLKRGAVTVN